jgi:predicted TIM-barrel fold metal-dependent hydrolase
MKIIDAHHHFWSVGSGNYDWLKIGDVEMLWGTPTDLPRDYFPETLKKDAGSWQLAKSVHVQCGFDPNNPSGETEWLQSLADREGTDGFPQAIVAYADFSSANIEEVLSQHCAYRNIRGIRQILNRHQNPRWNMAERDYLKDAHWRRNFGLLRKHDLSFDLQIYYQQADDAISLAQENSDTLFILNHAGMPADRDPADIAAWRAAMQRLAECPNMVAKISGLGMCDRTWTVESIRPFVTDMISAFGIERCLFGSNFPVDSLFSDYQTVWHAYDAITKDFSDDERALLYHDNAERYYRI